MNLALNCEKKRIDSPSSCKYLAIIMILIRLQPIFVCKITIMCMPYCRGTTVETRWT